MSVGSATACLSSFDSSTGTLDSIKSVASTAFSGTLAPEISLRFSLGDSGFSIIRNGEIFFEAPAQTHYFNCPVSRFTACSDVLLNPCFPFPHRSDNSPSYPRGHLPQGWPTICLSTGMYTSKSCRKAICSYSSYVPSPFVPSGSADLAPLGIRQQTDGLADNVHNSQILALLKHVDDTLANPTNAFLLPAEKALERARLLADVLVAYARLCMSRQDVVSPFERECTRSSVCAVLIRILLQRQPLDMESNTPEARLTSKSDRPYASAAKYA